MLNHLDYLIYIFGLKMVKGESARDKRKYETAVNARKTKLQILMNEIECDRMNVKRMLKKT